MAKTKTQPTVIEVSDFISKIEGEQRRDDAYALIKIYKSVTGFDAVMWGPSIIGFGSYHYVYESGHEGDMALAAFSPRKSAIVLYLMGSSEGHEVHLKKLGKYKRSKGCVYVKKLEDIDTKVLKTMISASVKYVKKKYL